MTDAGYNTYIAGKWHLGEELEHGPRARGFKRSFVSLDGAAHLDGWDWRGPQPRALSRRRGDRAGRRRLLLDALLHASA